MTKEIRKIEVVRYDPMWPEQFALEARQIKEALGDACIAIHHVGSTSVPGLFAKPKIDIIAVIKSHSKETIEKLEAIGFPYRGEFNIPMHYGFNKRGAVDVNLHVYEEGNPEIELNLTFRDYLRNHPEACNEYAALKLNLLKDEASFEKKSSMFTGYNLGKDAFIRKVLKLAGFSRLRFVRCTHYNEWDAVKRMSNQPINQSGHVYFVLYLGVEIIGYADIQLESHSKAEIQMLVIDEAHLNQGFDTQFLKWIEIWLKHQGYLSIKI